MDKDINQIKEELVALFEAERSEAYGREEFTAFTALKKAETQIKQAETQSDLLELLVHDCSTVLAFVRRADRFGQFLQGHFSESNLQEAGIFVNQMPEEVEQGAECLFVNATAERFHCALDVDAHVGFLGRWSVEARQVYIEALSGVHVTLRDKLACAHTAPFDSSVISLPECYYQAMEFKGDRRQLVRLLVQEGGEAALSYAKENSGAEPVINLAKLIYSPLQEKGDVVAAQDTHHTLVNQLGVNERIQGVVLYRRFSEQEVVQAIEQAQGLYFLSGDLWNLRTALRRETFLSMPNERIVIGKNHRGEEVSVSFNSTFAYFKLHNLYMKANGQWSPLETTVPASPHASLEEEIKLLQYMFKDGVQPEKVHKVPTGWKR